MTRPSETELDALVTRLSALGGAGDPKTWADAISLDMTRALLRTTDPAAVVDHLMATERMRPAPSRVAEVALQMGAVIRRDAPRSSPRASQPRLRLVEDPGWDDWEPDPDAAPGACTVRIRPDCQHLWREVPGVAQSDGWSTGPTMQRRAQ